MSNQHLVRTGVIRAASAYIIWGVIPIFWQQLEGVSAIEIVAHRIVWTLAFTLVLLAMRGRLPALGAALRDWRSVAALAASSVLIAINWGIFIWAVTAGRIIETSLGYYINPLVSFLLGVLVLGERLSRLQIVAIGLALLGVLNQTVSLGYLPWVSLSLAVSFGIYGLIRKTVRVESIEGLTVEAMLLVPASLGYLAYLGITGTGAFVTAGPLMNFYLVLAGPVTAIPLLLFASGARLVKLSTIGFLQYFAPSISLMVAVFYNHEPFTAAHAVTFPLIWGALALVSWDAYRRDRYSAA
jgi:chloramphenicol-sensitive protein RarD